MACLEFLLTELFQRRWEQHVSNSSGALDQWRGVQRDRLKAFLNWQLDRVAKSTGSPLIDLKAFPGPDLLVAR